MSDAVGRAGSTASIDVEGLELAYKRADGTSVKAFDRIDLDVRPGELLTLIGPSGCGKTSILRAIGGLVRPDQGVVRVGGRTVQGPMPDTVAYVFQDFALFPWRTAAANVEIALELRGVGRGDRRRKAAEALERVGLADAANRYPSELSGGMKQRVAIARALVADADVLLLDEPFGALDEQTRLVMGADLLRILEEAAKTIVFVTHSLQEAVYLSDRVVTLTARPGRVKEVLEVAMPRPRTPELMESDGFQQLHARLVHLLFAESSMAVQELGR